MSAMPAAMPVAALLPATHERSLRVDTVADYLSFLALEPVWNELVEAAGVEHPFLTHEWLRTWWECFGDGRALHVLVVRDGQELIGIAPLMRAPARILGLELRQLESIGNVHSPRFEFIVKPSRAEDAYRAIWRALASERGEWDVLRLCQLPSGSPTLGELRRLAMAEGFLVGEWPAGASPYVRIQGPWESYERTLDAKCRANLRNKERRLSRIGAREHRVISESAEVASALEEGFRIEAAAWKAAAGTAIVSQPQSHLFYTKLAPRAMRRGWLRLAFLAVNGRRIAFGYSLDYKGKTFLLKNGYDPEYASYSPFNQLCSLELRAAFDRGATEFDFLGVSEDWKLRWAPLARSHSWLYVLPDGKLSRLVHRVKFRLVPALQKKRALRALRGGFLRMIGGSSWLQG